MSNHTIENPGPYSVSPGLRGLFLFLAVVGFGVFALALKTNAERAWVSFLWNHFYFLSLGLGGLVFAALQWVTGAMWSATVRRLAESFTAYLPVLFGLVIVLFFGMHHLFEWTHPEHVKGDLILEGKQSYLNTPFFIIRTLLALAIWWFFSKKLIGNSLAQDQSKDPALTQKNSSWVPIFLILFGITFTVTSFDWIMSLDAHWFSTIFGIYCFAGMLYSTFAAVCLVTLYLKKRGALGNLVNDNHLHDLGKFMFAFSIFWAYIAFSQFMLIWYANLPEETGYYLKRMAPGWMGVTVFLLVGKFLTPFFILMPRGSKRSERTLLFMAVFMLFAQWIDVMWLIQPEFFASGPRVGWIELGIPLGFVGLFGFVVSRFLAKHNVIAIGDPKLHQSVFHHHQ